MGWIPHLSTYYQTHVGSYYYAPLCQATKAAAPRGPEWAMLFVAGSPRARLTRGLGLCPKLMRDARGADRW
jgi:hypothetical protein